MLLGLDWDEAVLERARRCLSNLMEERPVEVYAIALYLLRDTRNPLPTGIKEGVEAMARLAARNSLLDLPPRSWDAGMNIKLDDYARFIQYHRRCSTRLVRFLTDEELIAKTGADWIWYNAKCGICPLTTARSIIPILGDGKHPTTWWVEYWERVVARVGEYPCEEPFENDQIWNTTLFALANQCTECHKAVTKEHGSFKEEVVGIITGIVESVSDIRLLTDLTAEGKLTIIDVVPQVELDIRL